MSAFAPLLGPKRTSNSTQKRAKQISGDTWPDDVSLSDIEPRFICNVRGKRGADVRPDWS